MNIFKEIKGYVAHYNAGGKHVTSPRDARRAFITLYAESNQYIGLVNFYRNPEDMPDKDHEAGGKAFLNYSWQDFPQFLDLLRNEKPVYLRYIDTYGLGSITAGTEPVGEGEEDQLPPS